MAEAGGSRQALYRPPDPTLVRVVVGVPDAVRDGAAVLEDLVPGLAGGLCFAPHRPLGTRFGWAVAVGLVIGTIVTIGSIDSAVVAPEQVVSAPAFGPATPSRVEVASSPAAGRVYDPALRVAPTTCVLPAMGTTNESVEAWVQTSVSCLDAVWVPVLSAAEVSHTRPTVYRYRDEIRTNCTGELRTNGFYCGADQVIGVSPSHELEQVPEAEWSGWMLGIMAHEYGHHVQALAGILAAADETQREHEPGGAGWLEVNRRKELQANCLAGVAIGALAGRGSIDDAEAARARRRVSSGDDTAPGAVRDHGTAWHNQLWFDQGVRAGGPAACNTWMALAADVE